MKYAEFKKYPVNFPIGMVPKSPGRKIKRGRIYRNPRYEIGQDGADFINNVLTHAIRWDVFKCPRFIKR